jgi:hypothetical protein
MLGENGASTESLVYFATYASHEFYGVQRSPPRHLWNEMRSSSFPPPPVGFFFLASLMSQTWAVPTLSMTTQRPAPFPPTCPSTYVHPQEWLGVIISHGICLQKASRAGAQTENFLGDRWLPGCLQSTVVEAGGLGVVTLVQAH